MKFKNFIINFAIITSLTGSVLVQQIPQFSQYMYERHLYNPGYTGANPDVIEMALNIRRQYIASDQGPYSANFALHAPIRSKNIAVGGRIITDAIAPVYLGAFWGNFAYQVKMRKYTLSFGMEAGLITRGVDNALLRKRDPNDPAFDESSAFSLTPMPDFGAGIYFSSKKFYTGLSAKHLAPFSLTQKNIAPLGIAGLRRHYFLMAGGYIPLGIDFMWEPSTLIKVLETLEYQYDISSNFSYKNIISLGASYRSDGAIIPIARVTINKHIHISYSFDYLMGNLGSYYRNSHELLLRYDIGLAPMVRKINIDPRYF